MYTVASPDPNPREGDQLPNPTECYSTLMHLSIVSGTVWRAGDPREIDRANSPQGRRFDRQLYPASGTIDNPREN